MPALPSTDLFCLVADYPASGGAVFPQLELITTIDFQIRYALVGCHFSTTVVNASSAEPSGVFLVVGQTTPRLAISPTMRAVASHIMFGLDFAFTDDWIDFGKGNFGIDIPPHTPVSLYGFGQTAASPLVRLISTAALYLAPQ